MLEAVILYILLNRDLTMYAIHKHICEKFGAYTNPSFGAIKPALVRLEKQGFLTTVKNMSDGGKLSVYYSITKDGIKGLKGILLESMSTNPLQFFTDARLKLSCLSALSKEECFEVFENIKGNAIRHKANAEKILNDEYTPLTFYQKIVLDNTVCEYKNFISLLENMEKENERNHK